MSVGTVMLLRKMSSRWIVVAGCAVSIVSSLISLSLASTIAEYQYGGKGAHGVGLVFPIVTIVLALLPSTAAWIRAKQNGAPHPSPLIPLVGLRLLRSSDLIGGGALGSARHQGRTVAS